MVVTCEVFSNSAIFKSMVILHTMDMAPKVRLEDLHIKPYMITKLKMAGIESVFDLAISIPHQHQLDVGCILTGTDEHAALELATKAKTALVDSRLLFISHALYCKTKPQPF